MPMLDHLFEGRDLSTLHAALTLIGAGLALYVMNLPGHERGDNADPVWLQWLRRVSLGGLAAALLWSLNYSLSRQWQPWPPEIAIHVALISWLFARAASIKARNRREGKQRFMVGSTGKGL